MNQRHGTQVFWERWEEADSGDRLQATKYAEDIIFADKSAVRWTSFGWEPVYRFITQLRENSETEADLFMSYRSKPRLLLRPTPKLLCPPLLKQLPAIPVRRPPVHRLDLQRFRSRAGWTLFNPSCQTSCAFLKINHADRCCVLGSQDPFLVSRAGRPDKTPCCLEQDCLDWTDRCPGWFVVLGRSY